MDRDDAGFMALALEEARKGQGRTSPNPCVGAVIVRDGMVVGRGYHRRAGTPHAEIHAIADAGEACRGASIYVTLEPCNHTGRTPPCSRAVLAAGLQRVVIGMADPNPVAVGGADFLRAQGLDVKIGVLEQECRRINYPFLKHVQTGLPWVVMKAGMSLDARISYQRGQGGPITGPEAKQRVHELRDRLDAILIGVGTALADDPSLTTRLGDGGRDPLRVVLDSRLRLSPEARMLHQLSDAETWIFCTDHGGTAEQQALEKAGARVIRTETDQEGRPDLGQVLQTLGRANITSVLVEGGGRVHGSFLQQRLVDEVYLFTAPLFIGESGTPLVQGYAAENPVDRVRLTEVESEQLGSDTLIQGIVAGRG
jgi:diaminohydroxyphosphoribosylaminopyrimidine deaminase/5-amino-6-(5-phosphoribosylamino)uracil reductase